MATPNNTNATVEMQKVQAVREIVLTLKSISQELRGISAALQRMEMKRK